MQSVDGRIDCDMVDKINGNEYYIDLKALDCTAVVEGHHSYQLHTCGFEEFKSNNYIPVEEECFYKAHDSKELETSVDNKGGYIDFRLDGQAYRCRFALQRCTRCACLPDYRSLLCDYFGGVQYQPIQIIGKTSNCKYINIFN